jgi:8-oxo-dGTP pyrophosphatase MutT (NUDIX family)
MPLLMQGIVTGFGLKRVPYSKYAIGMTRLGAWAEWGGYPGMAFKTFAGILVYCKDDGTILMIRRSNEMKNPGKWDLPGGHGNKSDDDPFHTAMREATEEIGILPNNEDYIGEHVVLVEPKDDTVRRRIIYMYAISEDEKKRISSDIRLNNESDGFCWFKLDEIPKKVHFDLSWVAEELATRLGGGQGSGYTYIPDNDVIGT